MYVVVWCNLGIITLLYSDANGEPVMRRVWSKSVKEFRLKRVYTDKTYKFRDVLMAKILQMAEAPTTTIRLLSAHSK